MHDLVPKAALAIQAHTRQHPVCQLPALVAVLATPRRCNTWRPVSGHQALHRQAWKVRPCHVRAPLWDRLVLRCTVHHTMPLLCILPLQQTQSQLPCNAAYTESSCNNPAVLTGAAPVQLSQQRGHEWRMPDNLIPVPLVPLAVLITQQRVLRGNLRVPQHPAEARNQSLREAQRDQQLRGIRGARSPHEPAHRRLQQ